MDSLRSILRPVKLINLITISLSTFGFVYQVYLILNQYMLGETVVNIEVKIMKDLRLPTFTVCIPALFSIPKLSKSSRWNKTLDGLLDEYMNLVEKSGKANETTWSTLESNMNEIYNEITENFNLTGANFDEIFELSITGQQISILIEGDSESYLNNSYLAKYGHNDFIVKDSPINSLAGLTKNKGIKCFTYFSALKDIWDSVKTYSRITIQINNNFTQYPPVPQTYFIAIHSPNIIPRISSSYFQIESNQQKTGVKYSQLNVELLLEGFESNCAEYDIRNEHGTIRMESDCRINCIAEIVKEKFNSKLPWQFNSKSEKDMIRREVSSSIDNITIDFNGILDKNVLDKCSTKCKPDCNSKLYLTEIEDIEANKPWVHSASILFIHNSFPDIIVRHTLEMTLMSFVCNFGGLLGMWLGLSILSISKDVFESISRLNIGNKINFNTSNTFVFNLTLKSNSNDQSDLPQNQNNLNMVEIIDIED